MTLPKDSQETLGTRHKLDLSLSLFLFYNSQNQNFSVYSIYVLIKIEIQKGGCLEILSNI